MQSSCEIIVPYLVVHEQPKMDNKFTSDKSVYLSSLHNKCNKASECITEDITGSFDIYGFRSSFLSACRGFPRTLVLLLLSH